jgi:hypothetical protein
MMISLMFIEHLFNKGLFYWFIKWLDFFIEYFYANIDLFFLHFLRLWFVSAGVTEGII